MAAETVVAAAPAVGNGPMPAVRIGWLRGKLELKEFFRHREQVFFTLAFPVMLLLIFGSILNYTIANGALKFSHYFVPGILAAGLIGVAFQTLAIQIAVERDKGVLKRLEGTPMPPSSYFIGKVVMVLSLVLLESVILLALAELLGKVDLPTRPQEWLTIIWVTLLGTTAGALMGIAYSSVPRSGKAAPAVVTPVALVLQFLSGVYFVFTDLPPWMQTVGAVFPLKWIAQGYRSALLPDGLSVLEPTHTWEHARTALVLALWVVGALVVSLRTFRWRARKDA